MRLTALPVLALFAALPALHADDGLKSAPQGGHWNFGYVSQAPTFSGSYQKTGDTSFDTDKDLGLGKDKTGAGALLDYEGRRFLLHLGTYEEDYAGNQKSTNPVTINNTTYAANTQIVSTVKLRDYELDWTIKIWRWDAAYIGLDLGFNAWSLKVSAQGNVTSNGLTQVQADQASVTVPIPQVGLSVGGHIGRYADLRAYYHTLRDSGASYHRAGADLRIWPLKWLGVRVNVENEGFNVPKGSIGSDTTLDISKNGVGLGLLARF